VEYEIVNLEKLAAKFGEGDEVNPETLAAKRLISKKDAKVKILGRGEVSFPLKITAHAISAKAKELVEKSGGTVTLIK